MNRTGVQIRVLTNNVYRLYQISGQYSLMTLYKYGNSTLTYVPSEFLLELVMNNSSLLQCCKIHFFFSDVLYIEVTTFLDFISLYKYTNSHIHGLTIVTNKTYLP